jgi:D-alanyl-lipoteichoic acid acyltransferase DltB (MBOAT superfamily)
MTFTTPTFLIFLVLVFSSYWRCARDGQNRILVVASLVFYGWWDWRFLFLMLGVSTIDFIVARAMDRDVARYRRLFLGISVFSNLGTLAFFKYYDFFASSLEQALATFGVHASPLTLHLALPIGISFYTFQALSYTIDVYRREMKSVRSYMHYLSFITFFPQLVAGPIQRAKGFLPQFEQTRHFNYEDAIDGCRQMLWGFFKKMVIADSLSILVTQAFNDVTPGTGSRLLWATLAFTFQIYCDFSAYSDIAIGTAKLFGIRLMRNFAYPYFSRDIPEFWRRWHISLSTWFRDYVYIPLGGNRRGNARRLVNVMIVFLVSGLWHGANFTFVIWGALHGLAFFFLDFRTDPQARDDGALWPGWKSLLQMLVTFAFVVFAWIFFRAASVTQAYEVLREIGYAVARGAISLPPLRATLMVAILVGVEWTRRRELHPLQGCTFSRPIRWAMYYAIVAAILYLAPLGYSPFIYFQF